VQPISSAVGLYAIADFIVGSVLKPLCDLIDFLFGEAGE
jgi:hypothetical protein